jgi:hypothetical protein
MRPDTRSSDRTSGFEVRTEQGQLVEVGEQGVLKQTSDARTALNRSGTMAHYGRSNPELSLDLNPWPDSPWTTRAADLYGTNHIWSIDRIVRFTTTSGETIELEEANMDTVESFGQYCLPDCVVLRGEIKHQAASKTCVSHARVKNA